MSSNDIGIIIPPPEIKKLIEKTAGFIRKQTIEKGEDAALLFENELKKRNKNNIKFKFLRSDNPYYSYYKIKVAGKEVEDSIEIKEYERKLEEIKKKDEINNKKLNNLKKEINLSLTDKILQLHLDVKRAKTQLTEAPPPDMYTIKAPAGFTAETIDIIKLTAQFLGKNGRNFLTILQSKEANNPQFEFLKVSHPLFTYFSKLSAAYAKIALIPKEKLEQLQQDVMNPQNVIDRVIARRDFEEARLLKERAKKEGDNLERETMGLIDWHDFIVVETINFKSNEQQYLPEPCDTIEEMNTLFIKQQIAEAEQLQQQQQEEDMEDDDMDMGDDDTQEAIVQANMDRAQMTEEKVKSTNFQLCPICNEMIPVAEVSEHIRIELLDPKWKQHKDELRERRKETGLATGDSISANLSRIARKRGDVFINTDIVKAKHKQNQEIATKLASAVDMAMGGQTVLPPPPPQQQQQPSIPHRISYNNNNNVMMRQPPPPPPPTRIPNNMIPPQQQQQPNSYNTYIPPPGVTNMFANGMMAPSSTINEQAIENDGPAYKKLKTNNDAFLSEDEFLKLYSGTIEIKLIIPKDDDMTINERYVAELTDSVDKIRAFVEEKYNIPQNKQNLRYLEAKRFLKRSSETLAFNNVKPPNATIEISIRGRKKKKKKS